MEFDRGDRTQRCAAKPWTALVSSAENPDLGDVSGLALVAGRRSGVCSVAVVDVRTTAVVVAVGLCRLILAPFFIVRPADFVTGLQVVAMDGFAGYKTAAANVVPVGSVSFRDRPLTRNRTAKLLAPVAGCTTR